MRTSTWLSGRRTAPVLVVGFLVWGTAPPPAAAQCELDKLLASDGAVGERFGFSVSISGDVAVLGAKYDDDNGELSGSAYVFRRNGLSWVEEAKLTASDGALNDQLGVSVSICGDVIVVGAHGDDDNGSFSGSAYMFVKPAGGWVNMTQTAKLTASDGSEVDIFGFSVAISGDLVVVGAPHDDQNGFNSGSAYVFKKPPGGWGSIPSAINETAKLTASDGAGGDDFGISVSVSGDVAIVGALQDDDNGINSGSAYVFQEPAGGWVDMTQTAKITASDGTAEDHFGFSVAISGDVAVVAAPAADGNVPLTGSAYVFRLNGASWVQEAKLTASDGAAIDHFGYSVSISGDVAVVGATNADDNGEFSGSAYVFSKPPGGWVDTTETAKLTASDGASSDQFGTSVSISGDVAVVGAQFGDGKVVNSGSAYVFVGLYGLDYNGNGVADVCEALSGADITGPGGVPDGCVDAFDLAALLVEWCSLAGGNPCGTCGP